MAKSKKNKENKNNKDIELEKNLEVEEDFDDDEIELDENITNDLEENEDKDYEQIPMEERIYKIEKKTKAIFILVILTTIFSFLTLVVGISNNNNENSTNTSNNASGNNSNSEKETMFSYDTSSFKEISASEIESESKKDTIVVMIGRQGCTYCASFAPNLEKVSKEFKVQARYIDFAKIVDVSARKILDQEAYDTIANLKGEEGFEDYGAGAVTATPYTLFIRKNKIIYGIKGNVTTTTLSAAFEKAGFKK